MAEFRGKVHNKASVQGDIATPLWNLLKGLVSSVGGAFGPAKSSYGPEFYGKSQQPLPTATPQVAPQQTPAPSSTPPPSTAEIARKIQAGFSEYNKGQPLPVEQYISQFTDAAQRYPIFRKHPYLIPAVSLLETSGGKNFTNLKNPVSWGARVKDKYQPQSAAQAIEDMITGVGGDPNRGAGFDPVTAASRLQTAGYYQPFRESGDLQTFADTYEPPKNNPTYYKDLLKLIQLFEKQ